jgi:AraC-like DNA-binding protein
MIKPVIIGLPTDNKGHLRYRQRVPATARHSLALAEVNYWQSDKFSLLEQYYDAPDAFICLADIETVEQLEIEIHCQLSDLYWLYQLNGDYSIHMADETRQTMLQTEEAGYTQIYVPEGQYITRFPVGRHQLFYFVIKPNWLQRQGRRAMDGFNHLLDSQRAQRREAQHNQFCPIHDKVYKQLLSLFTLPKVKRFHYDILIYEHCFALLDMSQEDLKKESTLASKENDLLTNIRNYITAQIPKGNLVPVATIAAFFKVNYRSLRRQHYQTYGYSLGEFIQHKRMEQAANFLINTDMPIKEIAYSLGYTVNTSFDQRFKRYYGLSPTSYRLSNLKTPSSK